MSGGWIFANPEALINAAITGVFTPTSRWDYWSQPREKRVAGDMHIGMTGSVRA